MKKILFVGIAVILAVFLVTCDVFFPKEDEDVEYTDVVFSEDGMTVTVYLDGATVPVSKTDYRAMSTRLSKMAYDYLEVVFISGSTVARAQWELGQSAGISGVARGAAGTGINYEFVNTVLASTPTAPPSPPATYLPPTVAAPNGVALMAVGRKDGKTLLGIGQIGHVDSLKYAISNTGANIGYPVTIDAVVLPSTQSVTFYIESVKTGLLVGTETTTVNDYGIKFDSLKFTTTTPAQTIQADSKRSNLGGINYPLYSLPEAAAASVQEGTYTFEGAAVTYKGQLMLNRFYPTWATGVSPFVDVEMRIPRYMDSGRYLQPKTNIDVRSTVESLAYAKAPLNLFDNVVDLTFTRVGTGTGIYSFFIQIPVVLMTKAPGTNGGSIQPIIWNIRTGLGSELYSLDDGLASGGCVLMGIGVSDLDVLDIEWAWVN
jgi:hypothetical protein